MFSGRYNYGLKAMFLGMTVLPCLGALALPRNPKNELVHESH
jgi:hypothetical protein